MGSRRENLKTEKEEDLLKMNKLKEKELKLERKS